MATKKKTAKKAATKKTKTQVEEVVVAPKKTISKKVKTQVEDPVVVTKKAKRLSKEDTKFAEIDLTLHRERLADLFDQQNKTASLIDTYKRLIADLEKELR